MSAVPSKLDSFRQCRKDFLLRLEENMKHDCYIGGASPFYGSPLIRRYVNNLRYCDNMQQLLTIIENDIWESGLAPGTVGLDTKLKYLSSLVNNHNCSAQSFSFLATLVAALLPLIVAVTASTDAPTTIVLLAWGLILILYCLYIAARDLSVQRLKDCIDYFICVRSDSANMQSEAEQIS